MQREWPPSAPRGADGERIDHAPGGLPIDPAGRARKERGMRQLNYDLKRLQDGRTEGGFVTRRDRSYMLAQVADTLHELGFRGLRATGLRRKHVNALVREWRRRDLSAGTMKNRMAALRWWAERIGRPGVVGTNAEHGIDERRYVTNEDRSRALDAQTLARVTDAHVRMSLRLQAAFGLRREEAQVHAGLRGPRRLGVPEGGLDQGRPGAGDPGLERGVGRCRPPGAGRTGRRGSSSPANSAMAESTRSESI